MDYWKGKTAVVTGGSSGLGLVLARQLATAGSQVVLVARRAEPLAKAIEESGDAGARMEAHPADITNQTDVDGLFAHISERYPSLDLLVNCAGRSARGKVRDTGPNEMRELLELNFLALVRCTQTALPLLLKSQGHVVQVGSLSSKVATPFYGAYPASKFPVAAYAQQLRLELSDEGLHVLLVCPGPIKRSDGGRRYDDQSADLPESARQPGGGAKIKGLDADKLAKRILTACQRRQPELVMPGKARILFAVSQLSPSWGDWLLRKVLK